MFVILFDVILSELDIVFCFFQNEILLLEERLKEYKLADIYSQEIDVIKSQLEKLKEFYSELKLCCSTRTNHITSEDLEKRIEMVLIDHFGTLMSNAEKVKGTRYVIIAVLI